MTVPTKMRTDTARNSSSSTKPMISFPNKCGDLADFSVEIDGNMETLRQLRYMRPRSAEVENPAPGNFVAQNEVLQHGQRRHQHEVLMHHAYPEVDRIFRRT